MDDLWAMILYDCFTHAHKGLDAEMLNPESKSETDVTSVVARPPNYHSYLLRFWEERGDASAPSTWRFSLEDPQTSERHGFASLDALVEWIQSLTRQM